MPPQQPSRCRIGRPVAPPRALRCNAEGTCARHGSSAAARSALVISAHGNEVYGCCWVNASGLVTSRTTVAHCQLSGHHCARARAGTGSERAIRPWHVTQRRRPQGVQLVRQQRWSERWGLRSAAAERSWREAAAIEWRHLAMTQSSSRRPRSRCAPDGRSEHARRMDAEPPPPVAMPHANQRLGDRGRRQLGRLTVVAERPVAGGALCGRERGLSTTHDWVGANVSGGVVF